MPTVINFWCAWCELAVKGDRYERWFCSKECYNAGAGILG